MFAFIEKQLLLGSREVKPVNTVLLQRAAEVSRAHPTALVDTALGHCPWTLPRWTLLVDTAHGHCPWTLPVDTAMDHPSWAMHACFYSHTISGIISGLAIGELSRAFYFIQ